MNRGRRCVRDATLRDASLFLNTPPPPVRVDGCHATSGRFCRKWALILPWVLGFCAVFRRRRPLSTSLTWGNAAAARPFGLNPPAKPPRSRKRASHGAVSYLASPPRSRCELSGLSADSRRSRRDPGSMRAALGAHACTSAFSFSIFPPPRTPKAGVKQDCDRLAEWGRLALEDRGGPAAALLRYRSVLVTNPT